MVLTGSDGQLRFNGQLIGKVREWSLSVAKETIEDTSLGDTDRTYVEGIRSTTGTATVMYDPGDATAALLLNSVFGNGSNSELDFIFNKNANSSFLCNGFITSINQSVSVGSIQAVNFNFQVNGKPQGEF